MPAASRACEFRCTRRQRIVKRKRPSMIPPSMKTVGAVRSPDRLDRRKGRLTARLNSSQAGSMRSGSPTTSRMLSFWITSHDMGRTRISSISSPRNLSTTVKPLRQNQMGIEGNGPDRDPQPVAIGDTGTGDLIMVEVGSRESCSRRHHRHWCGDVYCPADLRRAPIRPTRLHSNCSAPHRYESWA